MKYPVILEISQITNSDDRAFVMALILNRCYEYWISRRHEATGQLKHLLLIEEAHNLLSKVAEVTNQEQANPKGKAVKNFANMLAEVRGFGQGIAISEQNPDCLIIDILVNTNTKIAHRVVEANNREVLERSMLLTPQQSRSLASLKVGQALFYVGGTPEPGLTVIPNFKEDREKQYNCHVSDTVIQRHFETFKMQYNEIYTPLFGCPTDPELAFCIEKGKDLAQFLLEKSNRDKQTIILQLLSAPFCTFSLELIQPTFSEVLMHINTHSLTLQHIEAVMRSAIAFFAWEVIQERAKLHAWLGQQALMAHQLLIQALYNPKFAGQADWIHLSSISESLVELGLVHSVYKNCEAPGAFRYEAKIILTSQDNFLRYLEQSSESASSALSNWVKVNFPFLYESLSSAILKSLMLDIAIQLTSDKPHLLPEFLNL